MQRKHPGRGNVLSHYFTVHHDIVDKYEKAEGVINEDVTEIQPPKKYDLIVSISTLEHVGWDESPPDKVSLRDPDKIARAIDRLRGLLNSDGKIAVTLPIGYNPYMDTLLKSGRIEFTKLFCLKRISKDNRWVETVWSDIANSKFNSPFPFANGLVIGIIES